MDAINELLISLAGSPWVLLAVALVCFVDGFFPPVPSESVVVGLAALALSTGTPDVWLLIGAAAVGAVAGDNLAYAIGRRLGTDRFAWMRRPRVRAAVEWARRGLERRGALAIFTARYIPVGRIAVNVTAGATGYPMRRFLPLSVLAGLSWAVYSVFIGVAVGRLVGEQPLLAVVVSIVIAAVLGWAIDAAARRLRPARRGGAPADPVRRGGAPAPSRDAAPSPLDERPVACAAAGDPTP